MSDDSESSEASEAEADEQGSSENGSPSVSLGLYDLSVTVDGGPNDDLDDLESTATDLMEYLVERHFDLEDGPDDRDRF